jgi:hypothetical protein
MKLQQSTRALILFFFVFVIAACSPGGSDNDSRTSWVAHWNEIAITASGRDHTRPQAGETRNWGEQAGPTRAGRALAIVHLAMYDAVMAIEPRYKHYIETPRAPAGTSMKAAIIQSAYDTLIHLFPAQKSIFDEEYATDMSHIAEGEAKDLGIALGKLTAAQILADRDHDGSELDTPEFADNYKFQQGPGYWSVDPFHPTQKPLTPAWGGVRPFVMTSSSQFRVPPPPALDSAEYLEAYNEVKRLGGDGTNTPTDRDADGTVTGYYWGYDGTPSLCAPVKLYNQIFKQVALEREMDIVDLTRWLAVLNTTLADAGIAAWESKYHWNFWRPVTAIRAEDGVEATQTDSNFTPLGAPAVNGAGRNFTPPFPAYPSGHAVFGGAVFEILRTMVGRDDYEFTFVSEEFDGKTTDQWGEVRPLTPRTFTSFSQAEEENGQSRIFLGIHWKFDKTRGIQQGREVADEVLGTQFYPITGE